MNDKKKLAIIVLNTMCFIVAVFMLIEILYVHENTDHGLPPGYELICSIEGKYSLMLPASSGLPKRISANVWDKAIDAKEFAWYWEKTKDEPYVAESTKYQWSQCKDSE